MTITLDLEDDRGSGKQYPKLIHTSFESKPNNQHLDFVNPTAADLRDFKSGMGVDRDEKNWKYFAGGYPGKFWNKNTHFGAYCTIIKIVLGDLKNGNQLKKTENSRAC